MGHPAEGGGEQGRARRGGHQSHSGNLGDSHQGNRGEVEHETGDGDPREEERADRQERRLRRNRGGQHRGKRRDETRKGAQLCERYDEDDRGSGPEREEKARIRDRQRLRRDEQPGNERQPVDRRTAQIHCPRGEVDDGHQRRTVDRGAAANDGAVRHEPRDGRQHGRAAKEPRDAESDEREPGENGDVAPGNCDDVIGPRFLQPPLEAFVEAGAIADDNRRDNRGRSSAPRADG